MPKKMAVSVFLLVFLLISVSPVQANGYQGASQWAVAELDKAWEYGLITERVRNQMNASLTREEFAEIAVKLYEKGTGQVAEAGSIGVFSDTGNPEIVKAYDLGIVTGTDAVKRLFSPHALISREQVATMLYRTIQAMGAIEDGAAFAVFMDSDQISPYAQEAVHYMGGWEFIKGSNYRFDPQGTCTREMAVLIAVRVYESLDTVDPWSGKGNENDPYTGSNDNYYNDDYYNDDYNNDDNGNDYGYDPRNNYNDPGDELFDLLNLSESTRALIRLLPDAQIIYVDNWDGGDGFVLYSTSTSKTKALDFYRDRTFYSQLKTLDDKILDDGNPGLSIETANLHYLIKAQDNPNQGLPTVVSVGVYKYMYLEPLLPFPM